MKKEIFGEPGSLKKRQAIDILSYNIEVLLLKIVIHKDMIK